MADNARKLLSQVRNAGTALLQGEITRISANGAVVRAQADESANASGLAGFADLGAGAGYLFDVATAGETLMRTEPSLTVNAGDTLWISETVAGCVTNVEPELAVIVGVVKNAAPYGAAPRLVMGLCRFCSVLTED